MKSGDKVRIVAVEESSNLGDLEMKTGVLVKLFKEKNGPQADTLEFWLVELDDPSPAKGLGGWAGVAISGSYIKVIG